ncbi:MAG: hypothetical protein NC131_04260 [Roseburia sp.]|nr:hypothetical protein [Roseburia sp.]
MKPRENDTAGEELDDELNSDGGVPAATVKEVRHTINAEETFTLAKDVFDLRCLIKSVYSNRAQIKRRLGIVSTVISSVFTLLYVAFMVFSGVRKIASYTSQIIVYSIIGVHALMTIAVIIISVVWGVSVTTTKAKRRNKTLRLLRFIVRLTSLIMGITAVVMSIISGSGNAVAVAVDTVALIISIVFVILSLFPIIFGGLGGLARWLMSPTKVKLKFSFVVMEWYQLLNSENGASKAIQKVSKDYLNDIGRCVDNYLIPVLGKRRVGSINSTHILAFIDYVDEADKRITEGVLKNVFSYALECGYVSVDPCKDMQLEGSIEVEEKKAKKKRPSLKERIGKKVGRGIINSIFGETGKE